MRASRTSRAVAGLLLVFAAACAGGPRAGEPALSATGSEALVREAQAFMESYARDLRSGAREAIAARYDSRGAYMVGFGESKLVPADSLRASYMTTWRQPASFEWRGLAYEPVGPDAVVVTGQFAWGRPNREPMILTYTGLLVRQNGQLRIRLEDEDPAPTPPPAAPAPPAAPSDSARSQ